MVFPFREEQVPGACSVGGCATTLFFCAITFFPPQDVHSSAFITCCCCGRNRDRGKNGRGGDRRRRVPTTLQDSTWVCPGWSPQSGVRKGT